MSQSREEIELTEVTIQHQNEEKPRFDNEVLGYFSALLAKVPPEELEKANHPGKEGLVFRIEIWMDNLSAYELGAVLHYITIRFPEAVDAYLELEAEDVDGEILASFKQVEDSDQDGDDDDGEQ